MAAERFYEGLESLSIKILDPANSEYEKIGTVKEFLRGDDGNSYFIVKVPFRGGTKSFRLKAFDANFKKDPNWEVVSK